MMKSSIYVYALSFASIGAVLTSGCVVRTDGRGVFVATAPVVVAPPPGPPVVAEVPDDYVWDGYEYVGIVGGQYYYLGPGNVWLVCEPFRLERFRGWERYHADWRAHAVRNEHFRTDHYGHVQPRREGRGHDDHEH
jgi:hypothetical protein